MRTIRKEFVFYTKSSELKEHISLACVKLFCVLVINFALFCKIACIKRAFIVIMLQNFEM